MKKINLKQKFNLEITVSDLAGINGVMGILSEMIPARMQDDNFREVIKLFLPVGKKISDLIHENNLCQDPGCKYNKKESDKTYQEVMDKLK